MPHFDFIYDSDGNCHFWYCSQPGVVLAYDDFSPEAGFWFCAEHWQEHESQEIDMLIIAEDKRTN